MRETVCNQLPSLSIVVPATIIDELSSNDDTVQEGDTVVLVCNVTGIPRPEVTWYRRPANSKSTEKESKMCKPRAYGPGKICCFSSVPVSPSALCSPVLFLSLSSPSFPLAFWVSVFCILNNTLLLLCSVLFVWQQKALRDHPQQVRCASLPPSRVKQLLCLDVLRYLVCVFLSSVTTPSELLDICKKKSDVNTWLTFLHSHIKYSLVLSSLQNKKTGCNHITCKTKIVLTAKHNTEFDWSWWFFYTEMELHLVGYDLHWRFQNCFSETNLLIKIIMVDLSPLFQRTSA